MQCYALPGSTFLPLLFETRAQLESKPHPINLLRIYKISIWLAPLLARQVLVSYVTQEAATTMTLTLFSSFHFPKPRPARQSGRFFRLS